MARVDRPHEAAVGEVVGLAAVGAVAAKGVGDEVVGLAAVGLAVVGLAAVDRGAEAEAAEGRVRPMTRHQETALTYPLWTRCQDLIPEHQGLIPEHLVLQTFVL